MGTLPNNMAILYDYLTLVGDTNWYAAPAAVVSTKNVEAIRINSSGAPLRSLARRSSQSAETSPVSSAAASPQTVNVSQPATTGAKTKTSTKKSGGE